ncbi:hypothetical protein HYALB_00012189 [Hymenoscyphus albidus]|uniref:Glycosyl hydrolase family 92 domain-containing protein n=1 Tax=Hymenoscyphus albidus TaxID=595503 RepID=A0A9N9LP44_9HELO|nr:hypothetical protein HYALB_00012189 [Hymenoscyphus albidus]
MLGLYPVVTQAVYLVLAPRFAEIAIRLGDEGGVLRITARGLEKGVWERSWVSHRDLMGVEGRGGVLEFEMGAERVGWDVGELPPSPGFVG